LNGVNSGVVSKIALITYISLNSFALGKNHSGPKGILVTFGTLGKSVPSQPYCL